MPTTKPVVCLSITTALALSTLSPPLYAQSEIFDGQSGTISDIGDVVQIALPAGALIGSLWIGDTEGAWQLTKGVAATAAITHTMKFGYERLRPDGSESNSFPSGHTSAAFSGAAYIHHRYGNTWGIPAYAAATFVGASRVWANRHYVDDVLAGGSIAVLSSLYFTDPYNNSDLVVVPSFGENHIGLAMSYTPGLNGPKDKRPNQNTEIWGEKKQTLLHSYSLLVGGFDTEKNQINEVGQDSFDLYDFSRESEPNTYAAAQLRWGLDESQYLSFGFAPMEARDTTILKQDINFGGKSYHAGSEVVSAYRNWMLSADYVYKLLADSDWILDVGGGVSIVGQSIRLDNINGENLSEYDDLFFTPAASIEAGYHFTESLSTTIGYRISGLSDFDQESLWLSINYQLNDRWATSLFAGQINQTTDTDDYYNDAQFDYGGFAVTYAF
ncbi:phosphoesterase PA-phosphatase related [Shewanella halifaxensis HAW-EB4]|uniref:undecaprenyl-diphosphate phosphatase n=1 Tax=Shewanella halifaxensis (strain HAW-EB4) TaxID=458817 RepID=B0TUF7_SHEHH|nr:phosphatase PAP2 family protein [Shewanella halifaxensis]ABZ75457.1 phosphoesterase PA-phosphatase related [Shewanella halifaxensis HAW-EB4]